jgi:hypothetical protein
VRDAYDDGFDLLVTSPYGGGLLTAFSDRRIYRANAACSLTVVRAS